jgi:hypothetical protein
MMNVKIKMKRGNVTIPGVVIVVETVSSEAQSGDDSNSNLSLK